MPLEGEGNVDSQIKNREGSGELQGRGMNEVILSRKQEAVKNGWVRALICKQEGLKSIKSEGVKKKSREPAPLQVSQRGTSRKRKGECFYGACSGERATESLWRKEIEVKTGKKAEKKKKGGKRKIRKGEERSK